MESFFDQLAKDPLTIVAYFCLLIFAFILLGGFIKFVAPLNIERKVSSLQRTKKNVVRENVQPAREPKEK